MCRIVSGGISHQMLELKTWRENIKRSSTAQNNQNYLETMTTNITNYDNERELNDLERGI